MVTYFVEHPLALPSLPHNLLFPPFLQTFCCQLSNIHPLADLLLPSVSSCWRLVYTSEWSELMNWSMIDVFPTCKQEQEQEQVQEQEQKQKPALSDGLRRIQ